MAEPTPRESLGAAAPQLGHAPRQGHWPHQLSHQPTLRVGDVMGALSHDFPSLTTSKVRFLDTQGLVVPQRTPAGYRLYSAADVERLRYVLRQQRDAYAPLSVIRERLELLDVGAAHEALSLAAVGFERSDVVSIEEAARLTGATADMMALLASEGIVEQSAPGRFDRSDVALLGACVHYLAAGADVRQLRALSRVAQREVEAAEVLSAPLKRQDDYRDATSSRHARLDAAADVFAAFVRRTEVTRP
ncbi:transcriptional regulator FtsR [Demequina lutea]|uniref:DNA-binding transcriptional MerR regulator n=1 Tax=Demequina lutea TaxID=431489 RepID=A0A7Z0CK77_9MICO|nr:MerR family transcriptional regulator [Demequina lutea]NYI41430.1 DNA-binding transcriptional MerR regulator [Demequina lutea]